jgi:MurNAc alpha-1-phosphate uridylyltransferase
LLGCDPFFTLNGDSIWTGESRLKAMEMAWDPAHMDALLLLIPRERAHGYEGRGDFYMDAEGRLSRVGSSVDHDKAPYVYIGVQIVNPLLFQDAPEGPFSMNVLWNVALAKGRVFGCIHQGDWFHMSTPEDLAAFEPIIKGIEKI